MCKYVFITNLLLSSIAHISFVCFVVYLLFGSGFDFYEVNCGTYASFMRKICQFFNLQIALFWSLFFAKFFRGHHYLIHKLRDMSVKYYICSILRYAWYQKSYLHHIISHFPSVPKSHFHTTVSQKAPVTKHNFTFDQSFIFIHDLLSILLLTFN